MARIKIEYRSSQYGMLNSLLNNSRTNTELGDVRYNADYLIDQPPVSNTERADKAGNTVIVLKPKEGGKLRAGDLPPKFYYDRQPISTIFTGNNITFDIPDIATEEEVREEIVKVLFSKMVTCLSGTDFTLTAVKESGSPTTWTLAAHPDSIAFMGEYQITTSEFVLPDVLYGFLKPDYGNF